MQRDIIRGAHRHDLRDLGRVFQCMYNIQNCHNRDCHSGQDSNCIQKGIWNSERCGAGLRVLSHHFQRTLDENHHQCHDDQLRNHIHDHLNLRLHPADQRIHAQMCICAHRTDRSDVGYKHKQVSRQFLRPGQTGIKKCTKHNIQEYEQNHQSRQNSSKVINSLK